MAGIFLYITQISPHACSPTMPLCMSLAHTPSNHQDLRITLIKKVHAINKRMTVVLRTTSSRSTIIIWRPRSMSKPHTPNQRWRRALQKVRQFVRPSRPYKNLKPSGLRRAKTRVSRKQWDYVPSDKLPAILEVFQANGDEPRTAESRKRKHWGCRRMQRKYAPIDRLSPIAEESEVGFKEALEAKTQNTEHWKVKLDRAKPRQH